MKKVENVTSVVSGSVAILKVYALQGLICGPVRSQPGGPVEKVVAAGGFDGSERLSTTEIYDIATDSWSKGTPLPLALTLAGIVTYKMTFLVVGGFTSSSLSDKIFLYEQSGEWREQLHMKLSEPKRSVAAMLIPSSLFD